MKTRTSCLLLITTLLAGCWQKSVNPFYTAKDLIAEPKLAGTWTEGKEPDGNRTTWSFTDAGEKRFDLAIQDKNEKHEFDARLFKIGDERFLDLEAKGRGLSTIPAHHLFCVLAIEPELKLAMLNTDWVQKWLRNHPGALAHIAVVDPEHRDDRDKDELVLTADTKALQNFVHEHWKDEDFFTEPTVLKNESVAVIEKEKK
jgi:hypothetical protein